MGTTKISDDDKRKALKSLLREVCGDIEVACVESPSCDDGHCTSSLSAVGDSFSLVTGIIPNADFLGHFTFGIKDVKDIIGSMPNGTVIIYGHYRNRSQDTAIEMHLKRREP